MATYTNNAFSAFAVSALLVCATYQNAQAKPTPKTSETAESIIPLNERVNVQSDTARTAQIIGAEWVGVGTNKPHAIGLDNTRLFEGKPSYRFELKATDNTLQGYCEGETKGRAELSFCYATHADFAGLSQHDYDLAQIAKTVYHHGKGICPQATRWEYKFSVYIPSELPSDASTIFAQWHGMPERTLVKTPEGEIKEISKEKFAELERRMIFKKGTGYDKVPSLDKNGSPKKDKDGNTIHVAAKKPNGWLVEQGGYPPLAFGFWDGYFYIKANSDRKWLTDKTDRCNANVAKTPVMKPVTSEYKASTIAYKEPFPVFPKDTWVTFTLHIDWSQYDGQAQSIVKPGKLDVVMDYQIKKGKTVSRHIVDNQTIPIGRNERDGYYFKFGIYRVGNSTVPVSYNLAGFSQRQK